ncbi:tryptophan 7-halogenase [Asticcacaulis sp. EMRT-3]|uniref:tryptophan halogenase family protein n=1 Tax=Asticcacaulis sp. EMRT-3 TaxID=3040349 RepID=UPI0024AF9F2F|nr:tryptophan 7-halogenase [Asticcacaulis sp. EMRT-3]MDI7776084.1 tryptophan 7-halogenase [Asticcacaulis sp. EMRT-3]
MTTRPLRKIVIVGGGTAGWMSAALLSKTLGTQNYDITLIESEEIGTVGVGEATVPPMTFFNEVLGVNEDEFVRETNATFKLGIEFVDWQRPGTRYFHPFGVYGSDMDGVSFNAFWLRMAKMGGHPDFGRFNAETVAARDMRFDRVAKGGRLPDIHYAYHFDATLYAAFLRRYSEKRGLVRVEGKVVKVHQNAENGYVTSVELEGGRVIAGDLFLDCTGFRGLLIEQTLKTGYEDWTHWLPCDRAAAVPCETPAGGLTPYVTCTSVEAGWQWRIPLQHRTGNGYVYCSDYISDDEACAKLLSRLPGKALKDPKILRFVTGYRKKGWNKNVVAIGLASGFLEPLESTSIHFIQTNLSRLVSLMPRTEINEAVIDEYNRLTLGIYENTKDFLVAHYKVTEREDTPFWKHCKYMDIPDSLKARLEIFRSQGHASVGLQEFFKEPSWFAVLIGQGLIPHDYNPVADAISSDELKLRLSRIRTNIQDRVKDMPKHDAFIARHCAAAITV